MLLLLHGGTVFTQPSPTQLLVRKIFLFLAERQYPYIL